MRVLARLVLVPLGIGLAALAALLVGSIGAMQWGYGTTFAEFLARTGLSLALATVAGADPQSAALFMTGLLLVSGGVLVLPVLLMAAIGEVFGVTSWIAYVLGTGVLSAAIPVLFPGSPVQPGVPAPEVPPEIGLGFAATGFAAGLVYWAVAGRGARAPGRTGTERPLPPAKTVPETRSAALPNQSFTTPS